MSGVSGLGYINYFKIGTATANSSVASLGPTNLASDQCAPSTGWQTANGVVTSAGGAVLRCTAATTSTWRAFALVNTNLTFAATVTASFYLSPSTLVGSLTAAFGPQTGYRQVIGVLGADVTADYVQFAIDDGANTDLHINIGGAFAGPLWMPQRGISWDTTYGANTIFRSVITDGGQEYRVQRSRRRRWNVVLDAVSDAEAWDDLGELDRIAAVGGNVLFIPNVDSVDVSREAVFGVLDVLADVSFPARAIDNRSWRASVLERL